MNRRRWRKRGLVGAGIAAALVVANWAPVAWGSMFGEENVTLAQMLVELSDAKNELQDLNAEARATAESTHDLLATYQAMHAGYEEIANYDGDRFLYDLKRDFYHQYPGFAELEFASKNMKGWEGTRSSSPWSAYEAITAVTGDVSEALGADVRAGRANVDNELILRGEAAGAFALADGAERETEKQDAELLAYAELLGSDATPGKAEMVTARTNLLIAHQNSFIIRLLSRGVRLDGVNKALEAGDRIRAKNYQHEVDDFDFTKDVLTPPPLLRFDDEADPGASVGDLE